MRRGLLVLAALLLAPGASARSITFDLEARADAFYLVGGDDPNPTLEAEAGDEVLLRFVNQASSPHNVHVGPPVDAATPCCQAPFDSWDLSFTLPSTFQGGIEYWSDAERLDHRGVLLVGEALPRVRILSPADRSDVGAAFDVTIAVENFQLEPFPATGPPDRVHGHARYLLDGGNASTLTDAPTFTFQGVPVGHHLVRVELVGRDGAPLDPPSFHEILVYRASDPTPPTQDAVTTTTPSTPASPTPGLPAGVIAAVLAGLAIASRSRRPPRALGP